MNPLTGKVVLNTKEELDSLSTYMVPINEQYLTEKQRAELQISKFDNRSVVGRKFLSCRQEAKLESLRKQKRKARKKAKQKSRNK